MIEIRPGATGGQGKTGFTQSVPSCFFSLPFFLFNLQPNGKKNPQDGCHWNFCSFSKSVLQSVGFYLHKVQMSPCHPMQGMPATVTDLSLAHTDLGTVMTFYCGLPELAPQGHTAVLRSL